MISASQPWPSDFWQAWLAQAPVLCVDVVLVKQTKHDNQVLLSLRSTEPYLGYWHLPGGVVRKNETLSQTLARVIAAEIGIVDYQVQGLVGIFDDPQRDPRGHFITAAFLVTTTANSTTENQQQEALSFYHPQQLPTKIGFDAQDIIKQAWSKFSLESQLD